MKITAIYYSSHFEKAFQRLPREIIQKAIKKESIFTKECFDPRLKTHKLKGDLDPYWSFSIDYSYRVLFEFQNDGSVLFIDVGTHSIYK